jgi:hypothetical protein
MGRTASFVRDGEILDGIITRSRGEIRRTCSLKVTSYTATTSKELRSLRSFQSPRLSEKVYSPRISELRGDQSPRLGGRGPFSPRTGEPRQSNLGKSG